MESLPAAHILVVANGTAITPALLTAIRERAARGPVFAHLLVPEPCPAGWSAATHAARERIHAEGERVLARALALIQEAGHCPADGSVSPRHDPMDAIEETLYGADFDEIVLSTPAPGITRWWHGDLPHRVAHLGLPVTTVIAGRVPAQTA